MPARSKAQQALFGMALAVRRKEMKRSEASKEVLDLADSDITIKELEEFAKTKHKGLPDHIKESLMDKTQRVFIVIKPEFLNRYQDILKMFEEEGFMLTDTSLKKLTLEEAQELYIPHKDEDFYDDLCEYMCSGFSLGLIFTCLDADDNLFNHVGKIKDKVREKYGIDEMKNAIHGSDSEENVKRESKIYF